MENGHVRRLMRDGIMGRCFSNQRKPQRSSRDVIMGAIFSAARPVSCWSGALSFPKGNIAARRKTTCEKKMKEALSSCGSVLCFGKALPILHCGNLASTLAGASCESS